MALKDLLEYQKTDAELRKIEQEIGSSEERKKFAQAKKFLENAKERLEAQDKRAVELVALRGEIEERCAATCKQLEEFSDLEEMVEGGGDLSFYKKNVLALSDKIRAIKAETTKLVADINAAIEEYKKLKEQTIAMQKQYKEYKEKYEAVKKTKEEEVASIKKRLAAISKNIPEDVLEKYKTKRKEGVFPILVPLTGGGCICGVEMSLAQQGKLSNGGVIECEHCRRIIYNT